VIESIVGAAGTKPEPDLTNLRAGEGVSQLDTFAEPVLQPAKRPRNPTFLGPFLGLNLELKR
jgi:hypothetical protein